jgi:heptosyltransferase II
MRSSNPEKILVRGVNWLGDAVMTTPALLRLREVFPSAHITLLTVDKLADIWLDHPAVDTAKTFNENANPFSVGHGLRSEKFDLAVVLPNSPRSALEAWIAGIPRRVGYAQPWRNKFLTEAIAPRPGAVGMHKRSTTEINQLIERGKPETPPPASAHHIYHYLHLITALGGKPEPLPPQLVVRDETVAQFVTKFNLGSAATIPWFGLNPGAEYGPAKRWPEERFIEAAIQIQRQVKCRWLIFGLPSDAEQAARMAAKITQAAGDEFDSHEPNRIHPVINLAGATSIIALCAGLKLCRAVLTNDSGPMHVAAALGTPVVVPFGSTSSELTGPGLPGDPRHQLLRANAPCSPCFLRECPIDFRCMNDISVEQVVAAFLRAIK